MLGPYISGLQVCIYTRSLDRLRLYKVVQRNSPRIYHKTYRKSGLRGFVSKYLGPSSPYDCWDLPLVPQQLNLLLALPLHPPIPLTGRSLGILPLQQHILQRTSTRKEQDQVSHDDAVSDPIFGLVGGAVDVAADNTVEVTPANDETEGDATFVDTFGIVGGPAGG